MKSIIMGITLALVSTMTMGQYPTYPDGFETNPKLGKYNQAFVNINSRWYYRQINVYSQSVHVDEIYPNKDGNYYHDNMQMMCYKDQMYFKTRDKKDHSWRVINDLTCDFEMQMM